MCIHSCENVSRGGRARNARGKFVNATRVTKTRDFECELFEKPFNYSCIFSPSDVASRLHRSYLPCYRAPFSLLIFFLFRRLGRERAELME